MGEIMAFLSQYWWVLAAVIGVILLVKIFGGEGGSGGGDSGPCDLTGSSGCM